MTPRTLQRTFLEVENAAALAGYPCLEARAAVATWWLAQEYGWPSAQETLTERQWGRLLEILRCAGLTVPDDVPVTTVPAELVPVAALGPYGHESVAGSLLALPGCWFRARQYISPLLTARMVGVVKAVEFLRGGWQVIVALRGRAYQRIPLGMFVSCTEPCEPLETKGSPRGAVPVVHSPEPGPAAPSRHGAGAAGGCGPTGAGPCTSS